MFQAWLAKAAVQLGLVAAVALLLGLSGWLWLSKRDGIRDCASARLTEIAVATEQGRTQAAQESAARSGLIAAYAVADSAALIADLSAIAERGQQTRTVYRDRVSKIPAASCAPGAERVEVYNALLRGDK